MEQTQVFGAGWCPDCRRTKTWLRSHNIPFTEFDTEADPEVRARAVELAGGRTNIPVVVTPDGKVLVEPTNTELAATWATHRQRGSQRGGRSRCR